MHAKRYVPFSATKKDFRIDTEPVLFEADCAAWQAPVLAEDG